MALLVAIHVQNILGEITIQSDCKGVIKLVEAVMQDRGNARSHKIKQFLGALSELYLKSLG